MAGQVLQLLRISASKNVHQTVQDALRFNPLNFQRDVRCEVLNSQNKRALGLQRDLLREQAIISQGETTAAPMSNPALHAAFLRFSGPETSAAEQPKMVECCAA